MLGVAVGCGRAGDGDLLPVAGTVKNADGSVIACESGTVNFQPTAGGKSASGALDKDGSFTLTTATPGDGVKPGSYKVTVQAWADYRAQKLAVPAKYGDASMTPLEATVDADHTHFDFVVEK